MVFFYGIVIVCVLDGWEDVCFYEGVDFVDGSSNVVVLFMNICGVCFGSEEINVVVWVEFIKWEENVVNDSEGSDVFGDLRVDVCYDEFDDGL